MSDPDDERQQHDTECCWSNCGNEATNYNSENMGYCTAHYEEETEEEEDESDDDVIW